MLNIFIGKINLSQKVIKSKLLNYLKPKQTKGKKNIIQIFTQIKMFISKDNFIKQEIKIKKDKKIMRKKEKIMKR